MLLIMLHVSVDNDSHQAVVNSKMHLHSLLDCVSQWIHCCQSCHVQVRFQNKGKVVPAMKAYGGVDV
jgi:hypothetical protein